jgi:molybdopterin molybdotransferase
MTARQLLETPRCGCDAPELTSGLLSIDGAAALIDATAAAVDGIEDVPLIAAHGRLLAADLASREKSPAFDAAAMDGYALSTRELTGSGPWTLEVNGLAAAGQPRTGLGSPGCAARIFTGAAIPEGADAVVMQEEVERRGAEMLLRSRPLSGAHIRRAGEDIAASQVVLHAGDRLGPGELAVAAAAGYASVSVRRRVRAAIVITGNEVQATGRDPAEAQIRDVNGPMLSGAMSRPDVDIVEVIHVGDRVEALVKAFSRLSGAVDLVVTTGGVSVGDADLVKPALRAAGGSICFEGVAIKPGKPVSFGRLGTAIWLGLPGNPVSAFVTWTLFGVRAVDRLAGHSCESIVRRHVAAARTLRHKPGRAEFRMARIIGSDERGMEAVDCLDATHSARVSTLVGADGLLLLPADSEAIPEGGLVEFLPLTRS